MSQMMRPTRARRRRAADLGPGEDLERREVGLEIHVRLFDPDEALDRRAVEHDPAVERLAELAVRDLDVLDDAEDVGELQAQELDALPLGAFEDVAFEVGHGRILQGSAALPSASCRGAELRALTANRPGRSSV